MSTSGGASKCEYWMHSAPSPSILPTITRRNAAGGHAVWAAHRGH